MTKVLIEKSAGNAANRAETAADRAETAAETATSAAFSVTVSNHKLVFTPPEESEG